MLTLNHSLFTVGRSRFEDALPASEEGTAKIYVKIRPLSIGRRILAQLDTGVAWSILEPEVAEVLGIAGGSGELLTLDTRFGRMRGRLVMPLFLLEPPSESSP